MAMIGRSLLQRGRKLSIHISQFVKDRRRVSRPINFEERRANTSTAIRRAAESTDFLRIRIKFLGRDVDVELLEVAAGYSVWCLVEDILPLALAGESNTIYQHMMLPGHVQASLWGWLAVAVVIWAWHLYAILWNRLLLRSHLMRAAFVLLLAVTAFIWIAAPHALVLKLLRGSTMAAFWSHIRLYEQWKKERGGSVKERRNADIGACAG